MMNISAQQHSQQQQQHLYSRSRNGTKIKRILLTRRYRHANVYHGKLILKEKWVKIEDFEWKTCKLKLILMLLFS